ncbi:MULTISPECIES: acylneuraminate cytidylyltransferase family protein [Thalassospira]|uniref:Acylneuraminate cytidylyltransferase n=1 Tax=Thalassospira povalilytica TaxID=732237 RepID=A0A8I1M6N9_9PROT|nr:acylneuraminate cytidylyltransferase family protein [Thalassospira povalilytica]MBN8195912.1 acylneuraminate cytidylyltransferase family protein [Thalassospira povalilytica]PKR52360.1 acylneuraminate cytidylyltransferase [Thalassospira povalilytica]
MISSVALIPARSGSKRVPNKNVYPFGGHPLLAYTVSAAIKSGVFDAVVCATDSEEYASVARYYGAEVPALRDAAISGDKSPDIEWVKWILEFLEDRGRTFDAFSILRPTSPFRTDDTIKRAWKLFCDNPKADSLRAIEKCKQHPGKMWVVQADRMLPILPYSNNGTPWHSSQYTALPEIYVQNASLEIARTEVALARNSIAGQSIVPFISQGLEGFDINDIEDIWLAERLMTDCPDLLPVIGCPPFSI